MHLDFSLGTRNNVRPINGLRRISRHGSPTDASVQLVNLNITLEQPDKKLALFGSADRYLRMIRDTFGVQIVSRDDELRLAGEQRPGRQGRGRAGADAAEAAPAGLAERRGRRPGDRPGGGRRAASSRPTRSTSTPRATRSSPRPTGQKRYVEAMLQARPDVLRRPGRHRQDVPRRRRGREHAEARAGPADRAGPPRRRGRRAARASCPATCRRRSTRTCARCSMPCTT